MEENPVYAEGNALQRTVSQLMAPTRDDGGEVSYTDRVRRFVDLLDTGQMRTLKEALPLLLQLDGKPYTLDDHFAFEDMYRLTMPGTCTFITGRQVAKTTNMGSFGVTVCNSIPNFKTLFVTPLFEQVRRFSSMYVGPFINNSPVKQRWTNSETRNSVLHRTFTNGSSMIFSFALLDADRIRGVSADLNWIDEIQDMMRDHLPIIRETMSHSDWSLRRHTGTPKTLDNTLEGLWQSSSQGEWFVPCFHCTTGGRPTWNIPGMNYHLEKMIGPWSKDISEKRPGTICHKCGKPISPRFGRWIHRYPDRFFNHAGYHVPQIIMPLHYGRPDKWSELLTKMRGDGNTPVNVFYNEVLGESYDTASKLVTMTDLQNACSERPNNLEMARARSGHYRMISLAVDWGGGGESKPGSTGTTSYTTAAVLGLRHDGRIDVLYGERLLTPHDHIAEAKRIKFIWDKFRPMVLAHDYTGAGVLRETFLIQAGVPQSRIMPCQYVSASKAAPCYHVAPTEMHPRHHYRVDKSRMILLVCAIIKLRHLSFFKYDHINDDNRGLIHDFLSLIEQKRRTQAAGEMYTVGCQDGFTDDFAQAVSIGCISLWYRTRQWPKLPELAARLTAEQLEAAAPEVPDWDDTL